MFLQDKDKGLGRQPHATDPGLWCSQSLGDEAAMEIPEPAQGQARGQALVDAPQRSLGN